MPEQQDYTDILGTYPSASKEYKKIARRSPILDPVSQ